jgi:molybdopterin/thiamine biosynthesis adenylyltransferase
MNENWHDRRDKRTDNCAGVNESYKSALTHICVIDSLSEYRVQLITYFTVIQIARWCRNIVISLPISNCLLNQTAKSFSDFLIDEVKKIDPDCKFTVDSDIAPKDAVCLYIGNPAFDPIHDFVVINASGWLSTCALNKNTEIIISDHNHTISACFAASLGNAELFRFVTGNKGLPYAKWYSLWTNEISEYAPDILKYGPSLPSLDLGIIHLIGCGAIGSSFSFLFPYTNCKASFLLVDPDKVEDHNTSSSLLFTYDDAYNQSQKITVCQESLLASGILAAPFSDNYDKLTNDNCSPGYYNADIVLCFANEHNIWSTIQDRYPPLCFHATTSKSWGVNIGRHIPLKENCVMCSFQGFIETGYTPVCAEVEVPAGNQSNSENHTAILPFLAPTAAVITLSELLKLFLGNISPENTVMFAMAGSEGRFVQDQGRFGSCFICSGQERLYPRFGSHAKHWSLSL